MAVDSKIYSFLCIYMEMQSVFAALADPTRFRIVEFLRQGEQAVSDVVQHTDVHQSGVSRHLGILLELGLVQVRRDGQHRLYSLRPDPFRDIEAWVAGYRSLWGARLDRLEAALSKKTNSRGKVDQGDSQ
jgi:DNA-binding transcriptional ArsR family regulator